MDLQAKLTLCFSLCLLHSSSASSDSHRLINIVPDSSSCAENGSEYHCASLLQCFSRDTSCISENTTLVFEPGIFYTLNLTGLLAVDDVPNLQIEGQYSTIVCQLRTGFMFRRTDNLRINQLNFQNCGGVFEDETVEDLIKSQDYHAFGGTAVSVIIANSLNVNLTDITIADSIGYGLFTINLIGNSCIHGAKISHSNHASIERYQHNFKLCKEPENIDCSGGNVMVFYEDYPEYSSSHHSLEISGMVAEFGVSLQNWDVFDTTEPAGGLTVHLNQLTSTVTLVIRDSTFTSNTGKFSGNAALLFTMGSSLIQLRNCSFLNGNAHTKYYADRSNSGGVYANWGLVYHEGRLVKKLHIENCTFHNNSGLHGGALHALSITDSEIVSYLTQSMTLKDSDVFENYGYSGIIRLQDTQTGESTIARNYLTTTLDNARIYRNYLLEPSELQVSTSGLEVFSKSALYGTNLLNFNLINVTISNNLMRGLSILFTKDLHFYGINLISGNVAKKGAGMKLQRSSFTLEPGSYLYITGNWASTYGGGIYIEDENKTCFFRLPGTVNITEPRIIVRDNRANLSGNSIFGGSIDVCRVNGVLPGLDVFNELFDISYNNSLTEVTSFTRQLCFCQKGRPDCNAKSTRVVIFPGQGFSVMAVAVGQLNGTVVDTAVAYIIESSGPARLGEQQDAQELLTACTQLNYSLNSGENVTTNIGMQTNYIKTHYPNTVLLELQVETLPCPTGFKLDRQRMVCDCGQFLLNFGVKCFIDQEDNIFRPFPVWIGYDDEEKHLLAHRSCALHHCKSEAVNLTLNHTDSQCQDGRSGILCGECRGNLSVVFGSPACKECSNSFLSLLLVFFASGIFLVGTMLYADLTLSRGTFNGLIFYANIIKVHYSLLFPPNHTNIVTVLIAWLNLDLGIETCFYNGMDTYARTGLQYVFPAYVWLLVLLVIFAGHYSSRVAGILGGNAVQVLASLLLLSYTKLQRIVLETWSSTFISHENGSTLVWLSDANVQFMRGRHIVLGVLSLVVVVGFLLPFTLILLCEYPLQAKFGRLMLKYKIKLFVDVYQGPYKMAFRWWTGAMLLVRGGLLLAFGLNVFGDPNLNLIIIVSLCTILLGLMWNLGTIYKQQYINMIESFFFVNLGLLSAWTLINRYNSTDFLLLQVILSYSFVSSGIFIFFAVVGSQVYFKFRKWFCKGKKTHDAPAVQNPLGKPDNGLRESLLL